MGDKWTVEKACARLTANRHRIAENKTIQVFGDVGIKLWGAIDYLCRYGGYSWQKGA
jgi:hypothetical protein